MPGYLLLALLVVAVPQDHPPGPRPVPDGLQAVQRVEALPAVAAAPLSGVPLRRERFVLQRAAVVPSLPVIRAGADAPPQGALVEYSDAYFTRAQIHRWASWAMLPLFALQYASGRELANKGAYAPAWARRAHGPAAAGVATLFAVNTVTGGWNLWQAREDPYGRGWRTAHGVLMLAADAGFVVTGLLAESAEEGGSVGAHQGVAIGSMALAGLSWLMMLPPFRRDG